MPEARKFFQPVEFHKGPVLVGAGSSLKLEGTTNNAHELTMAADPTADRTLTLPDATDTLVGKATTDVLTNKTIVQNRVEYDGDGAIAVTSHTAVLISADAGAYTIAAPTTEGSTIFIVSETSAAHVITGTNLFWAGVTGGPFNKLTLTAFPGFHFMLIGTNGLWMVFASALGTGTCGD